VYLCLIWFYKEKIMLQRLHRQSISIVFAILTLALLSGCASSTGATLQTGVVTETTLTDSIETSGTVSAKQIATLNWATSGNILEVYVQNNDLVATGDELMKLDSTSASTEVLEAISDLVIAKQNLANIQQSTTSLAEAEVALVNAQTAYDEALKQYYLSDEPLGSAEYIAILQKDYLSAQQATLRAFGQYNGKADLSEDDPIRAAAYASLAQARINEHDALIRLNHFSNPPTAMEVDSIKANLALAKADLDEAQRTYDHIKDGNTAALTKAQSAVDAAQTNVNKLSIIAPFDGQVAVVYSQKGDVVNKNTKALVLVDRSQLSIDVLVDELSISSVEIGDSASISFDALGITTTGKVALIDPIGVTSSSVVNYTVRVVLDEADSEILIGATAAVVIITGEPSNVMFVPVSAVLNDAEGEYVTLIKNDGSTERVAVVTGDISDEKVEVDGNLIKGEMVQLYTTTTSDTSSSSQSGRGGLFGLGGFMR
jgi:RND family efflux transporter MFP subunit